MPKQVETKKKSKAKKPSEKLMENSNEKQIIVIGIPTIKNLYGIFFNSFLNISHLHYNSHDNNVSAKYEIANTIPANLNKRPQLRGSFPTISPVLPLIANK